MTYLREIIDGNRCSVGIPARQDDIELSGIEFAQGAALRRNNICSRALARFRGFDCDLTPVRRPAGQVHREWRRGQLELLAAIDPATPEVTLRIRHVAHPLAIARKGHGTG